MTKPQHCIYCLHPAINQVYVFQNAQDRYIHYRDVHHVQNISLYSPKGGNQKTEPSKGTKPLRPYRPYVDKENYYDRPVTTVNV